MIDTKDNVIYASSDINDKNIKISKLESYHIVLQDSSTIQCAHFYDIPLSECESLYLKYKNSHSSYSFDKVNWSQEITFYAAPVVMAVRDDDGIFVRMHPGSDEEELGELLRGSNIKVLGEIMIEQPKDGQYERWFAVDYDNSLGYIIGVDDYYKIID